MSKHTPGPWKWERVKETGWVTEHTLNGPDVLCRYWYDNPPTADARLIAAAPEMLSALKAVVPKLQAHYIATPDPNIGAQIDAMIVQCQAAIAAAEGKK